MEYNILCSPNMHTIWLVASWVLSMCVSAVSRVSYKYNDNGDAEIEGIKIVIKIFSGH